MSFQVLVEERSISGAARRLFLTQSAMSRVFDRLRRMFDDQLLVRAHGVYEPTRRALQVYAELEVLLPNLEMLLRGKRFIPSSAQDSFRIAIPDSIAVITLPKLMKKVERAAPGIRILVLKLDQDVYKKLEANLLDLAILINIKSVPPSPSLRMEPLFEEEFVCLLRKGNPIGKPKLTLERYLSAKHISVLLRGTQIRLIEEGLGAVAHQRNVLLTIPYSFPIAAIVEHTDMIATLGKRLARKLRRSSKVQMVAAPGDFPKYCYSSVWHARYQSDPAHVWFRKLVKSATSVA